MPAHDFHYTLYLGKTCAEVWTALTDKALVDLYYMCPLLRLEPQVGGVIEFGLGSEPSIAGTILTWDEGSTLEHTFRFVDSEDAETRVNYQLDRIGDAMCRLHIAHTGFTAPNQTLADIAGGWPVIASSLKTVVETGKPLPWPHG